MFCGIWQGSVNFEHDESGDENDVLAMSYQYGNHCVTNSNKATDHDCSTAGNLGLDFPPNYHAACSDGSGVAIKVGSFAGESFGSQLTSRGGSSSTINNVHNTCNAAIVVSPDAAVGVAKENNLLSDNVDGGAKKAAAAAHDITPVCSLPPYSDIKGLLLQDSHDTGGVADSSDQKAKLSFMSSKAIRNELKKTFLGNVAIFGFNF